jgi:hypothetical protein
MGISVAWLAACASIAIAFGGGGVSRAASTAGADTDLKRMIATTANASPMVLANDILNRWEPIAVAAGVHTSAWREMYAIQLTRMDSNILRGIDAVAVDSTAAPKVAYARFTDAFRSALMQAYMAKLSDKGSLKLGSATADQVFIPITPYRVVDSRNLLGPVVHGDTRNYQFYAASSSVDFGATQGGLPGAAGAVCPGTVNPNGGAPAAAVVTITVVGPTAGGNFVLWGGASPAPLVSVLNWNNPGDIAANTTVVPAGGRTGSGPGGAIQDFAVLYNGPSGQAQVIADVVGYFVENQATALECVNTAAASILVPANELRGLAVPNCPTGYARTGVDCTMGGNGWINVVSVTVGICDGHALATASETLFAGARCCRIPGR